MIYQGTQMNNRLQTILETVSAILSETSKLRKPNKRSVMMQANAPFLASLRKELKQKAEAGESAPTSDPEIAAAFGFRPPDPRPLPTNEPGY